MDLVLKNAIDFLHALKSWGFPVNNNIQKVSNPEQLVKYHQDLESKRNTLGYEIDGSVFKVDSIEQRNILGLRSRSPRWAAAGKFKAQQSTTIKDIVASVGRTGASRRSIFRTCKRWRSNSNKCNTSQSG